MMKKADIIIIVVLLVLAMAGFGVSQLMYNHKYATKYVDIYVQNKLKEHILVKDKNFTKKIEIKTELGTNVIEISNDGAKMISADCHDKICVKEGFKDKNGQTIVCLPNKVVVEIKGEDKAKIDGASF
jgi:hypothetical protein